MRRRDLWKRIYGRRLRLRGGWREEEVRSRKSGVRVLLVAIASLAWGAQEHPILPIGSAAPDFALPGVDGKIHRLPRFSARPGLAVGFTINHSPTAPTFQHA